MNKNTIDTPLRRFADHEPVHPGLFIDEIILPAVLANNRSLTRRKIAAQLSMSHTHFYGILSGKRPINAAIAVRVAAMFGGSAGLFTRMQTAHDDWHAARSVDVSHIPSYREDIAA